MKSCRSWTNAFKKKNKIICFTYFLFIAENNVRKTSIYNPSQINSSLPRRVEEQPPLEHGDRHRQNRQINQNTVSQSSTDHGGVKGWGGGGGGVGRNNGFLKRSAKCAIFPKQPLGIPLFQILWVSKWCFQLQKDWKRSVSQFWAYFVTDFLSYLKCSQANKKREKRDLYRKRKVTTLVNRPFARWRHFTTTTRILQDFAFLCKLGLWLFKPHRDYKI